jgi:hypothetical protein
MIEYFIISKQAGESMVEIKKIAYQGWPNCIKISNDLVELIVTTDVGPRIIHFSPKDGENMMYINPAEAGSMGDDKYHTYGGHRLWHAPEDFVRTYAADNFPVKVDQIKNGVRLTADTEFNGVQKVVEIQMSDDAPTVKVNHIIINHTSWTIPFAVWSITVMGDGGKLIVPHADKIGHDKKLTPTHLLALWGYTKMDDPRWTWGDKYYMLRQDVAFNYAQKVGSLNTKGWAAYWRKNSLFIKKFGYDPDVVYPDFNCNFETYTDQVMLEVESLGPNVELEPGKQAEHTEEWSLFANVKEINSEADIEQYVLPLL